MRNKLVRLAGATSRSSMQPLDSSVWRFGTMGALSRGQMDNCIRQIPLMPHQQHLLCTEPLHTHGKYAPPMVCQNNSRGNRKHRSRHQRAPRDAANGGGELVDAPAASGVDIPHPHAAILTAWKQGKGWREIQMSHRMSS